MLRTFPLNHAATPLSHCTWIDLIDPSDDERATVEKTFGLRVPTQAELAEIETTSRLRAIKDVGLSDRPAHFRRRQGEPWIPQPTGFVLSEKVLLTVRFAPNPGAFDAVAKELAGESFEPAFAFVRLLEVLVDRTADLLETSSHDLDDASHVIFRPDSATRSRLSHETVMLRRLMIRTGRTSQRMARIQYALVCLDRMAKFTVERAANGSRPSSPSGCRRFRPTSPR